MQMNDELRTIEQWFTNFDHIAIAVSGGVDSLTLGVLAGRVAGGHSEMFHARSAAVPPEATQRTRELAHREQWKLHVIDAGEFNDPDYMANPANRCFHCKTDLYHTIRSRTTAQIVSGTNTDDLGEYRPGLQAAEHFGVRHPYVEVGIDKAAVRRIARTLGLDGIAELPASPCLSSRIETGIPIQTNLLSLVHRVERTVADALQCTTVRCRMRASGVVVELGPDGLSRLSDRNRPQLQAAITALLQRGGLERPVSFEGYRNGSAFLHSHNERM
jgi:uncharacterized protein